MTRVTGFPDCTGIEYSQIYAQLKEELLAGARHWFNKEEEHALQYHNMAYYHRRRLR